MNSEISFRLAALKELMQVSLIALGLKLHLFHMNDGELQDFRIRAIKIRSIVKDIGSGKHA